MRRKDGRASAVLPLKVATTLCLLCLASWLYLPSARAWLLHNRPTLTGSRGTRALTKVKLWRGFSSGTNNNNNNNNNNINGGENAGGGGGQSVTRGPSVSEAQQQDQLLYAGDASTFDGFEGYAGKRVSYGSAPKASGLNRIAVELCSYKAGDLIFSFFRKNQFSAVHAPDRVQEAVMHQLANFVGLQINDPYFNTKTTLHSSHLANLLFKLQMLGYMFHMADERLALTSSLNKPQPITGPPIGNITGQVTLLTMEGPFGKNVTMPAQDVLSSLVKEVEGLREMVQGARVEKEIMRQSSLITYIRNLPEEEQRSLTEKASDLAVDAMRKLSEMMILRGKEEGSIVGDVRGPQSPLVIPDRLMLYHLSMYATLLGWYVRVFEKDTERLAAMVQAGGVNPLM